MHPVLVIVVKTIYDVVLWIHSWVGNYSEEH